MTVIVEDGTLVANANSYVSENDLMTYCTSRGYALTGLFSATQLLVLAADYIESQSYVGDKSTKNQTMMWPRIAGYSYSLGYSRYNSYWLEVDGYPVQSNEIPKRIKTAQLDVAMNLDKGNDFLTAQGQSVLSEKIGPLEVKYQQGTTSSLYLPRVTSLLGPLLKQGGANISVGRA